MQYKLVKFICGLERNKVFTWKNSYEPLHQVCDGTSWNVQIVTKQKNYSFEGNNEYLKECNKFCKDVRLVINDQFS